MKAARSLIPLAIVLLGGCATATPYQPAIDGMGYSEQKLETNRYKVAFSGNSSTPRDTVENYLLYRAAEVTLANGYDYFVLVDRNTDKDTSYRQDFSGGFGSYTWFPHSSYWGSGVGISTGTATPSNEYQARADILCYRGRKPDTEKQAFDARDLKANLEASIVRPKIERRKES